VASHLLKWVHHQQDTEGRDVELRYFRDTDGWEVDFVLTENRAPVLLIEAKSGDRDVDRGLRYLKARFSGGEFLAMLVAHIALRFECRIYSYGTLSTTIRRALGWMQKDAQEHNSPEFVVAEEESEFVKLRRKKWARLISKVYLEDPSLGILALLPSSTTFQVTWGNRRFTRAFSQPLLTTLAPFPGPSPHGAPGQTSYLPARPTPYPTGRSIRHKRLLRPVQTNQRAPPGVAPVGQTRTDPVARDSVGEVRSRGGSACRGCRRS